jgi:hypothetical protein
MCDPSSLSGTFYDLLRDTSSKGGLNAPSAINGPLGPVFYPNDKSNIIKARSEKDTAVFFVTDNKRHVGARSMLCWLALMTPVKSRPYDFSKEIQSFV